MGTLRIQLPQTPTSAEEYLKKLLYDAFRGTPYDPQHLGWLLSLVSTEPLLPMKDSSPTEEIENWFTLIEQRQLVEPLIGLLNEVMSQEPALVYLQKLYSYQHAQKFCYEAFSKILDLIYPQPARAYLQRRYMPGRVAKSWEHLLREGNEFYGLMSCLFWSNDDHDHLNWKAYDLVIRHEMMLANPPLHQPFQVVFISAREPGVTTQRAQFEPMNTVFIKVPGQPGNREERRFYLDLREGAGLGQLPHSCSIHPPNRQDARLLRRPCHRTARKGTYSWPHPSFFWKMNTRILVGFFFLGASARFVDRFAWSA